MSPFGSEAVGALSRYRLSGQEIDLGRVQAALRESDEWWDALFNVAGIGILFGTIEGEVLAVSPSLVEVIGYTREELMEVGILEITHPDDREADLQLFGELVEGKRDFYQLDKRYFRKNGDLMWGRLTIVLLRDESGQPCFVIGMVEDITATRYASELESRLRESEAFKRQALQLNDEVLQALVVAKLAFDSGETEKGHAALATGLGQLKRVIDHMLAQSDVLAPGDFVRGHMFMGGADA
ncbi:MAG: PAS domain S-box protein [Actinobacteria bacterium]|nr:PAS domain S-box protein [Actinomycetota bacterium]